MILRSCKMHRCNIYEITIMYFMFFPSRVHACLPDPLRFHMHKPQSCQQIRIRQLTNVNGENCVIPNAYTYYIMCRKIPGNMHIHSFHNHFYTNMILFIIPHVSRCDYSQDIIYLDHPTIRVLSHLILSGTQY